MGDLFFIVIGIVVCILFKKYDDGQKAKIRKAEDRAAKKSKKEMACADEVAALRTQVEELTRAVKASTVKPPTE